MKKVFYSFAVAAMAAVMVSCGGNTNANGDADSTAVEGEEVVEAAGSAVVMNEFAITLPEGWDIKNQSESSLEIKKDMPDNWPKLVRFYPNAKSCDAAEQSCNKQAKLNVEVAQDPVEINGITYYVLYKEPVGSNKAYWWYYVDLPGGGLMTIQTLNDYNVEDPEVKAIFESIQFK